MVQSNRTSRFNPCCNGSKWARKTLVPCSNRTGPVWQAAQPKATSACWSAACSAVCYLTNNDQHPLGSGSTHQCIQSPPLLAQLSQAAIHSTRPLCKAPHTVAAAEAVLWANLGNPLLLRVTVSLQSWQPSPHLQAKLPLALLGDSTSCHICGGGSSDVCGTGRNICRGCSHVCWCLLDHHGLCSNDSLRLLDHHGLCSHNGLYWLLDHHGLLLDHHLLGLCCHNGLRLGGHNLDGHRDLATAAGSGSREQQQRQRGQGAGNHSRGRGEGRGRAGWNRETQHAVLLGWVTVCRLHQAAAN